MTDDFKIPDWAKTTVLSPRRWMGLLTTSPNIIRVILPQEHAGKYVMMSSYAGVRLDIDGVSVLVVKTKDVVATFDHLPVTVYPDSRTPTNRLPTPPTPNTLTDLIQAQTAPTAAPTGSDELTDEERIQDLRGSILRGFVLDVEGLEGVAASRFKEDYPGIYYHYDLAAQALDHPERVAAERKTLEKEIQDLRAVLNEFVDDVLARGVTDTRDDWLDISDTFNKALKVLGRQAPEADDDD